MSDIGDQLSEAARRIFADHARGATAGNWPAKLWAALQDAGFDRALLPESKGGAALGWSDAFELLFAAGEHAAAVPLTEALIGNWLAERAGIGVRGLVSIAPLLGEQPARLDSSAAGWRIEGSLPRVAWGRVASHVATVFDAPAGPLLALVEPKATGVSLVEGTNVAGEPRDTIVCAGASPQAVIASPVDRSELLVLAAISRSALIAGAIARTLALAVDYANLRVQFGRPIGKFQAIQQSLAVLAGLAVASRAASESACEAVDDWLAGSGEPIATNIVCGSAKIRAGEAAGQAAAIAHQVFGAIGFTEEHELHHFTKRLWAWRDEYGNEAFWSRRVGERILAVGGETLWPMVAGSTARAQARSAGV